MKSFSFIASVIALSCISSCNLLNSVSRTAAGVGALTGRTLGLSHLTDEAPDPIVEDVEASDQGSELSEQP
jgi:hypothetical protein